MSAINMSVTGRPWATLTQSILSCVSKRVSGALRIGVLALPAMFGLSGMAGVAHAAPVTYHSTAPSAAIPDGLYAGTPMPGNVVSSSITIDPISSDHIEHLSVTVRINHDYVGDLSILLEGPNGQFVTLTERPGGIPVPGFGSGNAANLSADVPITFDDHAESGIFAYAMGAGLASNDIVGDVNDHGYNPDNFIPSSITTIGGLDSFIGQSLIGTWTLHVGDWATGGTGTLEGWSITATAVPAPGAVTAGLLLMGGLVGTGLIRRPRRRGADTPCVGTA